MTDAMKRSGINTQKALRYSIIVKCNTLKKEMKRKHSPKANIDWQCFWTEMLPMYLCSLNSAQEFVGML